MFNINRVMTLCDGNRIILHLNGKEIYRIEEITDTLDFLKELFQKVNKTLNGKPYELFNYWTYDIKINDEASKLLYSVQQFTQAEEKAFIEKDWETLNQLLLQRIEDGDIE